MKKVSLLVLLAIVASTLLMAAIPTTIVRLTIVNKSGYDVYMKLEGSGITEAFYYLTVPSGTRDEPVVKVFTVMSDLYKRTTWQCNGLKSSGSLLMQANTRLTFTPCGEKVDRCSYATAATKTECTGDWVLGPNGTLRPVMETTRWGWVWHYKYHGTQGERTMEKVTYFKYPSFYFNLWMSKNPFRYAQHPRQLYLAIANLYAGYWNFGCITLAYRIRTWRTPVGCWFSYQY